MKGLAKVAAIENENKLKLNNYNTIYKYLQNIQSLIQHSSLSWNKTIARVLHHIPDDTFKFSSYYECVKLPCVETSHLQWNVNMYGALAQCCLEFIGEILHSAG